MSGHLSILHPVTPAKAGAHRPSDQFTLRVQGMDSRLRGNDEVAKIGEVQ